MTRIMVISAGLSTPSSTTALAQKLTQATQDALVSQGMSTADVEITHVELRSIATNLAEFMVSGNASDTLAGIMQGLSTSDGLIAVTPIFKASYNGLFKMFFDALDPEPLTQLPTLIGATAGTRRHQLALDYAIRPLFSYLKATVVPTAIFASRDDLVHDDSLGVRIERASQEFAAALLLEPRPNSAPHSSEQ